MTEGIEKQALVHTNSIFYLTIPALIKGHSINLEDQSKSLYTIGLYAGILSRLLWLSMAKVASDLAVLNWTAVSLGLSGRGGGSGRTVGSSIVLAWH